MKLAFAVILGALLVAGCSDGSDEGGGRTTAQVVRAPEQAGLTTRIAPTLTGSGIESIVLVAADQDEGLEVAVFDDVRSARAYADGVQDTFPQIRVPRFGNVLVMGGSTKPSRLRQRVDGALMKLFPR